MISLNSEDFEAGITVEVLASIQKLAGILTAASWAYVAVGFFYGRFATVPFQPPVAVFVFLLSLIGAFEFFGAGWLADKMVLKQKKIIVSLDNSAVRGATVANLLRAHNLLRLVFLHAVSIYGLLIAIQAGGLARQDPLWLGPVAVSALVSLVMSLTFPTKDRLWKIFRRLFDEGSGEK
jgi:hypothetical protein